MKIGIFSKMIEKIIERYNSFKLKCGPDKQPTQVKSTYIFMGIYELCLVLAKLKFLLTQGLIFN
jgi:hypothetical protein